MIDPAGSNHGQHPRNRVALLVMAMALLLAFSGFVALGIWQLHRLSWKLDLIERVDARIHANPVAAPAPAEWPQVNAPRNEYLRVRLQGHFLADRDTRVQALTALGAGFWILTPFQQRDGSIVLVNRGFIPSGWHDAVPPASATAVIGLLRISEPGGGFLRHNTAAADRWYSRDVAAIARARSLDQVAPFFVDAEPITDEPEATWPRAGLTVTHFSNNHLGYALTWFALALLVTGATWCLVRVERSAGRS